jgi:alpha-ribazole phosphatase
MGSADGVESTCNIDDYQVCYIEYATSAVGVALVASEINATFARVYRGYFRRNPTANRVGFLFGYIGLELALKLTLVRHTTLQIAQGVCYGQTDIDVSANFMNEVIQLKQKLAHEQFDAVYASPLQRCSKLAQALDIADVNHDERLKELHFGDWEMLAWDDIPRDDFDVWAQNYAHMAPPNGETFAQLQQRGVDFLTEMSAQHAAQHVLVVTHGGMIRALIAHALNMQLKGLFRLHVDYVSATQLNFGGSVPRVEFVNR